MNPDEFIKLAGRIISFGPAGVRSAVSRAYYGAFNEAMDVLEGIGCGCPRNAKAHNLVVVFLDFSGNAHAKQASSMLSDLHTARLRCDYRLSDKVAEDLDTAKLDVETSERVVSLLERFQQACQDPMTLRAFQSHIANIKQIYRIP